VSLRALVDEGQSINYCNFVAILIIGLSSSKLPSNYGFAFLSLFSGLQVPRILPVTTTPKKRKKEATFKLCFSISNL
jgi:hypothetical protein